MKVAKDGPLLHIKKKYACFPLHTPFEPMPRAPFPSHEGKH